MIASVAKELVTCWLEYPIEIVIGLLWWSHWSHFKKIHREEAAKQTGSANKNRTK